MDRLLAATHDAERTHFWYRGFRRFVRPLLVEATRGVSAPCLLDCGCGTGANLELLAEYGRVTGFDLTPRGLELAKATASTPVVRAHTAAIPFRSGQFDVLTSFDVLYCLSDRDEQAAVGEFWRVLKPGGALIVNLAALDVLRGTHSVLSEEVRRYTRAQTRALLEAHDFRIVRLTYTNCTLFPPLLLVRWAQRLRGLDQDPGQGDFAPPPAPINALLSSMLAVEARLLRWMDMPIGSSVLCLARKVG